MCPVIRAGDSLKQYKQHLRLDVSCLIKMHFYCARKVRQTGNADYLPEHGKAACVHAGIMDKGVIMHISVVSCLPDN